MRVPAAIVVLTLTVAALILSATGGVAQTEEDKVMATLKELRESISTADSEAAGKLLSDSGFVAIVGIMGETVCLGKEELVALLSTQGGGDAQFEDLKVSVHWAVALASGKVLPADMPLETALTFDAILMREAGEWKFAAMLVCQEDPEPSDDDVKAFVDRVSALPSSLKEGAADELNKAIYDEKFILAFVDPGLELRWANSKSVFVQMIESVIPMVTVNESHLDVEKTVLGSSVAVVDGNWLLDITDFGETNSEIRAYAVKVDGEWKVVAIGGGPAQ